MITHNPLVRQLIIFPINYLIWVHIFYTSIHMILGNWQATSKSPSVILDPFHSHVMTKHHL